MRSIGRNFPRRQYNSFRNGYAYLNCKGIVKKFFVGAPPEWIVDNGRAADGGVFKKCAIKRYVLGNTVDNNGIVTRIALHHLINPHWLSANAFHILAVHPLDKSHREAPFLSEKHAYFFHNEDCGM